MKSLLRVEIISSREAMRGMSKHWNDLLTVSQSDTIFLTWEWMYSWVESFLEKGNHKPFILAIYKRSELIGIAPWFINNIQSGFFRTRQIEFIGIKEVGSDYVDVFAKKGKELAVSSGIYDFLFQPASSLWDTINLQDIPADSLFLLHFLNKLGEAGKYFELDLGAFTPIAELPDSVNKFHAGLSRNRREQFSRHLRILKRGDEMEHTTVLLNRKNSDDLLSEFFSFYQNYRTKGAAKLLKFLKNFSSNCSGKESIQIDFLKVNRQIIAGLFHLRYRNSWFMYLMVADRSFCPKVSIGNVLLGLCIENAIRNGNTRYDFLKGSEPYKFHWANGGKRSLNLTIYQKRFWNLFLIIQRPIKNVFKWVLR